MLLSLCMLLCCHTGEAQDVKQLRGVIHLQTAFDGSGRYSLDQLVAEQAVDRRMPLAHRLLIA